MVNELQYARMNFQNSQARGNYSFIEYPKWVKLRDGTKILVRSALEETQILTDQVRQIEPSPVELERNDLSAALQKSLAEMASLRDQLAAMEAKMRNQEDVHKPVSTEVVPEAPSPESHSKAPIKSSLASLAKS